MADFSLLKKTIGIIPFSLFLASFLPLALLALPCATGEGREIMGAAEPPSPWIPEVKQNCEQPLYERLTCDKIRVVERWKNGQKKAEGEILDDGTKIGFWIIWCSNGQKLAEGEYNNAGQKEGLWTVWHENGQKMAETQFRNGKAGGTHRTWDSSGRKTKEMRYKNGKLEGEMTEWHISGNLAIKRYYKNGLLEGRMTIWDRSGNLRQAGQYVNGIRTGLFFDFHKAGLIASEIEYQFGKNLRETRYQWFSNGVISHKREFKEGKIGVHTAYYENGQKEEERKWFTVEDERKWFTGPRKTLRTNWYKNGQKKSEGKMSMSCRQGEWLFWREDGAIDTELTGNYKNGIKEHEASVALIEKLSPERR